MLSRRHVLLSAGAVCCAGPAIAALAPPPSLSFRVLRNGAQIGTHSLRFSATPESLTVNVSVQLAVYFGPVRLFHYAHDTVERWQGGVFQGLDSRTDYDGEPAFSTVRRENGALIVEGSKAARYIAPAGALPATHWNRAELAVPMINPENGLLLTPHITDKGPSTVALASGTIIAAHCYGWRDKTDMDLWYDDKNIWASLIAAASDGSQLVYERL